MWSVVVSWPGSVHSTAALDLYTVVLVSAAITPDPLKTLCILRLRCCSYECIDKDANVCDKTAIMCFVGNTDRRRLSTTTTSISVIIK